MYLIVWIIFGFGLNVAMLWHSIVQFIFAIVGGLIPLDKILLVLFGLVFLGLLWPLSLIVNFKE